jgi:hypothetical protein
MKEISQAINKVMEKVNWVAKNMTVWSGSNSYKWVADKDVKQAIREAMIENWLSLLPIWWTPKIQIDRWEEEIEDYKTKKMVMKTKQSIFTDIETKYLLLHISWESIEVYWYGQWVDTQDKWAGKATTYALKNTLLNMFLIPTWVDTDDTHSDDLEVPKKKNFWNKKWYNEVEKNIDKWNDMVQEWTTTPKAIIDKIESEWYSINNANKDRILNLK